MKRVLTAAAAVIVLVGCGGQADDPSSADQPSGETTDQPTSESTTETPDPDPSETEVSTDTYNFGLLVDYADGVGVTVREPRRFEPGEFAEYATRDTGDPVRRFTVFLANNSSAPINAGDALSTVVSDGREAGQVWDTDEGITFPTAQVGVGDTFEFDIAFQVADPNDIEVQIAPTFTSEPATFVDAGF